jgi:molecular chaperone GrpE
VIDPQRPADDPAPTESTGQPPGANNPIESATASDGPEAHGAPEVTRASGTPDAPDAEAAPGTGDATQEPIDLEALVEDDPRTRAELYGALLEAEAQRDEYLDDLRRARAEFDNYRRRVMREGATQRDSGKAEAFNSLLEVLDDLERTVEASEGSDDPSLAKGLQLVATKLVAAVGSQGLTRIDAVDAPFDPNEHEAVQQQPGDEPTDEPIVTQVLRPGYRLGDRVLRPAMVVVRS